MIRHTTLLALAALALMVPAHAVAAGEECEETPRAKCFGVESLDASLSTTQAGAHPDLTFTFDILKDPASTPNKSGLKDAYAPTRNVRIELPPGLIGDPNVFGVSQQCTTAELASFQQPGGGCPNGSQIGRAEVFAFELGKSILEPVYMMRPPGGEVAARIGFIAGAIPVYANASLRSDGDYGLNLEIVDAPTVVKLIKARTTTWGVPADPVHDTERCTANEAAKEGCRTSEPRPPGSRPLPFLTNPTRCGVPLEMRVGASSWVEPDRFDTKSASFPQITGCNNLPFGPSLSVQPTSHRAAAPSGADVTIRLPASEGVKVLEPAQIRDIKVQLPPGLAFNPAAGDGLATCSNDQVRFKTSLPSDCPDAAKLADTEFDIPVLERNLKGAIYLREPEPDNPFRIWITADEQGLHVKLQGELQVDKATGEITTVTMGVPQAPVREARLLFKSGFRAPLVTPSACGTYRTKYEFTPWSGGPPVIASTPLTINEGCDTGGFAPKITAGTMNPAAGEHSPFVFTLTREDGEQNPSSLDITLPKGLAATFAGIPRCDGAAATTGACPAASRLGSVKAAVGAGPAPLWVPQPGKRPTAIYLGGPYKGGPLSIIAVVPKQAGPFDFGDETIRSAVYVNPVTAEATIKSDSFPQRIEGIPVDYRSLHVAVDRPNFTLNPTSCERKSIITTVTSTQGAVATPSSPFTATNCAKLDFKPKLAVRLFGGTKRGSHPKLKATLTMPKGGANIGSASVALPHSEFLDQSHIRTVCTRVQFRAEDCPAGSIYGKARATSPLIDEELTGNVYLRSSNNPLPDMVVALEGPPSLPIKVELAGRVDSINGGIRSTFDAAPDAPVSSFTLEMQGGKKGLLENSTNLCRSTNRVTAKLTGQNGKKITLNPALQVKCKGKKSAKKRKGR